MSDGPRLFIALYTDEHISAKLAEDLREKGYQAESAQALRRFNWDDSAHLAYAAERQMAVLTFDHRFRLAADERIESGQDHWGVIISPELSLDQYALLLHWTLALLDKLTADELYNAVVYLQQFRE
jgi:predicted nuclease of predicted toxin-antitoxin system